MPLFIGTVAGLTLLLIILYNRLVKSRNMVREAWSGIDVQLKRRYNLIPNLVEAVKGYSSHEQSVLEEVARKRSTALSAQGTQAKSRAENDLTSSIKAIFALAEAYPQLKASESFLSLQEQLAKVEDQIQLARRYYNGAVRLHNTRVESFPSNLTAKLFGVAPAEFFALELSTEGESPTIRWEG